MVKYNFLIDIARPQYPIYILELKATFSVAGVDAGNWRCNLPGSVLKVPVGGWVVGGYKVNIVIVFGLALA